MDPHSLFETLTAAAIGGPDIINAGRNGGRRYIF